MKNNSVKVTSIKNESSEPLIFNSMLECAKYFKLSCPSIKKKLNGETVKALVDYIIVEYTKEPNQISKDKEIVYWTCDVCNKQMRQTSKTCHLISRKHLENCNK